MNSNWFKLLMKMTKVEYGKNLLLKGMPVIFNKGGAKLKIGKNVTIKSSFLSNLVGLYSRTIIVTRALGAVIEIGDNVGISGATIYARKGIYIGENTCIGGNCKILDNDFHPIEVEARNQLLRDSKGGDSDLVPSKEIRIGKNCFLGCNSKSGHILYMGALMYLAAQILLIIRDLIFRFFYAMENTKDTVSNSIISCVFNIIMSLILVKPLGMYGVILGTFISGAISMVMILFRMKKLYGLEKFGLNLFELIKNIIVLVISVFAIILIKKHIIIENDVMAILIYGVLTVIIFVILAIIFKLKAIKIKL